MNFNVFIGIKYVYITVNVIMDVLMTTIFQSGFNKL